MTYVNINGIQYPAIISGRMSDKDWDDRPSKAIKLEMTHDEALSVFCDGAEWSIITENTVSEPQFDEEGNPIMMERIQTEEFDNSEYNLAGDVTDHRDGTVTVKMGKLTPLEEAYEIMLGGI
jgi:hypothetical protein